MIGQGCGTGIPGARRRRSPGRSVVSFELVWEKTSPARDSSIHEQQVLAGFELMPTTPLDEREQTWRRPAAAGRRRLVFVEAVSQR